MRTYTTVLGDTFDKIALQELGSEYLFPSLLQENPAHRNTIIFSAGVVLNIPDQPNKAIFSNEPDWLAGDGDAALEEKNTQGKGVYG